MSAQMIVGLPGNGKSYESANITQKLLRRNIRWYKKAVKRYKNDCKYKGSEWEAKNPPPNRRLVWVNLKISPDWLESARHAEASLFLRYWDDVMQLTTLKSCDVVVDEIARYCDSRDWQDLHPQIKAFFQEADKRGIDIYANTQFPMQVDIMFRRSCEKMWLIHKVCGSRRPDETKPPVRFVWGLMLLSEIERSSFSSEIEEMIFKPPIFAFSYIWNWRIINTKITSFFDTKWKIQYDYPPYEHIERYCSNPNCKFKHVQHA